MLRPTAAREYMSWQSCSFFWSCQSLLRWSDESAHGVHDRSEQLKASGSLIRQKCQRLRSWGLSSRELLFAKTRYVSQHTWSPPTVPQSDAAISLTKIEEGNPSRGQRRLCGRRHRSACMVLPIRNGPNYGQRRTTQSVRNDGEDHRHVATLQLSLALRSAFALRSLLLESAMDAIPLVVFNV